ncbi:hypothetical protein [Marinomonas mediterranea]|uniref:Uncharacterized protein n=1 Tax=Marinomonas mediterranea (strain ATCC 700492 / JCM 21426 / NBRC 103028 / MMB-1) TaxID=717774 RepID=F2JY89_MARM1|nr:hypothetical protein [Marinomonas mediterranea]ADZ91920.1 hypothetical protein Marme_2689 [Marinomonas mediterranea MMB-1]WCN09870.1 hypothetical protein GV055_13560 [Marinomonas mediterranea]WCN13954.1 hypothetical protein GV054_13575 [Marinomonas mediterranea]WCN18006.1 hypothetical protein GV053_13600 [Marinomonas mediterranea MMB-1]
MYVKVERKQENKTRQAVCGLSKSSYVSNIALAIKHPFQKTHINTINSIQLMKKTSDKKNQWQCNNCGNTGLGKPPKKCKECKSTNVTAITVGREPFEKWWLSLDKATRQNLLRKHGSHEQYGGLMKKDQGGNRGGNQHSNGNAIATQAIKAKYEAGAYDSPLA